MLLLRRLGGATTITPSTVVVVLFRSVFWSLFLFLFLVLLLLLLMTLIALHRLAFCLLLFGQPTAETTRLGQHNTGTTRSWQSWLSSWQLLDPCLSLLCRFLVLAVHLLHFYKIYIYIPIYSTLYGFGCSTFPRRILLAMAATSLEFSSDVCSVVDEELPAQRLNEPKCQIDWNQRQRYIHVIAPIAGYFLRHT